MSRPLFWAAVALLLLAALSYPLQQLVTTGGYVYYTNGYDEATYLQYDFARAAQALTRPGQFGVSLLHEAGLSGGWINLLFDAVGLALFAWLSLGLFLRLGFSAPRARGAALLLLVLPQAFMTINPVMDALYRLNVRTGAVYWINLPELDTPALLRTPEPQVSLVLLAAAVLVALRFRSVWPVYGVLPFMYPFVSIPAAFVALAIQIRSYWRWRAATAGPLLVSFLAIGTAAWGYYNVFVGEQIRVLLVDTRLPLLSVTALLGVALYAALRERIAEPLRFFALAAALAPLVASNHQVISGHLAQPNNFEQYAGVFTASLVLILGIGERAPWRRAAMALGTVFFLAAAVVVFRDNHQINSRLAFSPELVRALATSPDRTAVNDVELASVLAMVHPRQASTALGLEKSYPAVADRHVAGYRCIKKRVFQDHPQDAGFRRAFARLDAAYVLGSQNYMMVHINRKREFKRLQSVGAAACDEAPALRYFLVEAGR